MMFAANILPLLLLATTTGVHAASLLNMDVVMRGGDVITGMDEGSFPKYRNRTCTIRYPRNGNWATQNGYLTGGWDANQRSYCQGINTPDMTYRLQRDGNFVAYCGTQFDYSTNTGQQGVGDYFLGIDDDCILHLYEGAVGCDSVTIGEELWTNIRFEPLRNGDRLGQGEMVRFENETLVLQSSDGNLVLYDGHANIDTVLWAANWESSWHEGANAIDLDHYYVNVHHSGVLELVGKDMDDGTETVYFSKALGVTGCFTVEYDGVDDLVGVPCA